MPKPVIVVHGGCGVKGPTDVEAIRTVVKEAVRAGHSVLASGGTSLDATETAVVVLENHPSFNAGFGSALTMNGEVEMDAAIMEGRGLRTGGVACVTNIRNPISLARLVMEKTDHILLAGPGANELAAEYGVPVVPTEDLISDVSRQKFESYKDAGYKGFVERCLKTRPTFKREEDHHQCHDTVGAVALDCHGDVAYACSTGGIVCKRPGRVGDSPIVGAGGYADNVVGAVTCTGHGESISRVVLAHQIICFMKQGMSVQEAADTALADLEQRTVGYAGVIVVGADGQVGISCTTSYMPWAYIQGDMLVSGNTPGNTVEEPV